MWSAAAERKLPVSDLKSFHLLSGSDVITHPHPSHSFSVCPTTLPRLLHTSASTFILIIYFFNQAQPRPIRPIRSFFFQNRGLRDLLSAQITHRFAVEVTSLCVCYLFFFRTALSCTEHGRRRPSGWGRGTKWEKRGRKNKRNIQKCWIPITVTMWVCIRHAAAPGETCVSWERASNGRRLISSD